MPWPGEIRITQISASSSLGSERNNANCAYNALGFQEVLTILCPWLCTEYSRKASELKYIYFFLFHLYQIVPMYLL